MTLGDQLKKKDLYYINTAKALGISLVLFAHLSIPHTFLLFISSLRMPLFFLVSGMLFTTKEYTLTKYIKHKFNSLMIPYFFFALFSYLFYIIIGHKYLKGAIGNLDEFIRYAIGIPYAAADKSFLGFNIPIWFLPCLFSGEVIFFVIIKYFKKYALVCSVSLFILGIIISRTISFRLIWGLDVAFFAIIFIHVGYFIRKKNIIDKYILNKRITYKVTIAIASLLISVILLYFNSNGGAISVYNLHFNNYILFIANAFFGIIFILTLSIILPKLQIFNFYGRNTIILLGFHLNIFAVLKGIQVFIFRIPLTILDYNFIYNLCYLIITLIVFIPIILFINRYCPYIIGRKKAILQ